MPDHIIDTTIKVLSDKIDNEGKKDAGHVMRLYLDRAINSEDEDLYLIRNGEEVQLVVETEGGYNCTVVSLRKLLEVVLNV